jgi:hypothetical protein
MGEGGKGMHHGGRGPFTLEEAVLVTRGIISKMKSEPKTYRYDVPSNYPILRCSMLEIVKRHMDEKRKLFESIDEKDIAYQDADSIFLKK